MSVIGTKGVGLPTILLHEGEAHVITVELKNGTTYRGELVQSEDSWNLLLKDVKVTTREGKEHTLNTIYLRGNQVRFIILPDMLQNGPMFTRVRAYKRGITVPGSTGRGIPPPGMLVTVCCGTTGTLVLCVLIADTHLHARTRSPLCFADLVISSSHSARVCSCVCVRVYARVCVCVCGWFPCVSGFATHPTCSACWRTPG